MSKYKHTTKQIPDKGQHDGCSARGVMEGREQLVVLMPLAKVRLVRVKK